MSTNATRAGPTVQKEVTTYMQLLIKCTVDTTLFEYEHEHQYLDAFELPPTSDPKCHRVTLHRASDLKWVQQRQPKLSQQVRRIVGEIRRASKRSNQVLKTWWTPWSRKIWETNLPKVLRIRSNHWLNIAVAASVRLVDKRVVLSSLDT